MPGGRIPGHSSDAAPHPGHGPLTSPLGAGTGLPSLPTGGGGSGFPFSGFHGLLGGLGGFPGGGMPPTAGLTSAATPPAAPSLGMDFGRGLAAGATAAGAVPPVPQAPMTPLAAPVESAPIRGGAGFCSDTGSGTSPRLCTGCTGGWPDALRVGAAADSAACAVGRVGAGATVDTF